MQRLTWRWLWIWVGVLVAGCGQFWSSNGTPSSTREPTLPLLGYTRLPPTPTLSLWPVFTVTPLTGADSSSVGSSSVALFLSVGGPACYETPLGSLVCLGQVHNPLDKPVEQVAVGVQLLARDGTLLADQETGISRWLLPAGAAGPYRVIFDTIPDGYLWARPYVKAGQIAGDVEHRYASLALREVSGAFVLDQYQVTVSITNKSLHPVSDIAVTMTLLDELGHVTGFKREYLDTRRQLAPGETVALSLKVIPQGPNTVGFDAFAEGYLVQN